MIMLLIRRSVNVFLTKFPLLFHLIFTSWLYLSSLLYFIQCPANIGSLWIYELAQIKRIEGGLVNSHRLKINMRESYGEFKCLCARVQSISRTILYLHRHSLTEDHHIMICCCCPPLIDEHRVYY